MVRTLNYLIISFGLIAPVSEKIDNPFLWTTATIGLLFSTLIILEAISFEDNLMMLAFLVTLPWIFYVTGLPGANDNIGMFLVTIFLAVSIPLVMVFLVFQLASPMKE